MKLSTKIESLGAALAIFAIGILKFWNNEYLDWLYYGCVTLIFICIVTDKPIKKMMMRRKADANNRQQDMK